MFKQCSKNAREREQKYIEEFRKRILTIAIKKRNNLRESNRINFFHGRGGIVYPPFILTFFLLPSPAQASNEKGARVSTMEYIKKKRKRKRKRKMARNQRAIIPFVLSHLRAGPPLLLSRRALPPPLIGRRFILPLYRGSRRIATL